MGEVPQDPAVTPEVVSVASPLTVSPQILTAVSLAVAVLLSIVVFLIRRRSSSRGNAILFVGPPDGGKTAILSTLVYKQTLPTHASLQTNISAVTLPNKKVVSLVDIPGHPRIRDQFRDHMSDAKAVVFVVDASSVSRNGPAVAEHLHNILHALTSIPPSQTAPSLLLLAHKCDLLKTSTASAASTSDQLAITRVRTILERELEKRRASQTGGVGIEGLGEEGEAGSEMGGLECSGASGGVFKFAEWEGGEVELMGTSVSVGKAQEAIEEKGDIENSLSGLLQWLEDLP